MKERETAASISEVQDLPETGVAGIVKAAPNTVLTKLNDALSPAYQAEFDPDEAETAGAFEEDALSEADALGSTSDDPPPDQIPLTP